jgi:hypothetical protein
MKSTIFWYVTSCSLVEVHQHFGGIYCLQAKQVATKKQTLNYFLGDTYELRHEIQEFIQTAHFPVLEE